MADRVEMIKQYLHDEESYLESYDVKNIEIKGDIIQFESSSPCGNYNEKCQVELLDVMVWLYESNQTVIKTTR